MPFGSSEVFHYSPHAKVMIEGLLSPMPFGSSEVFHGHGVSEQAYQPNCHQCLSAVRRFSTVIWEGPLIGNDGESPMPFGSSEVFHKHPVSKMFLRQKHVTNAFRQFGGFPQVCQAGEMVANVSLSPMPFGSSEVFHPEIKDRIEDLVEERHQCLSAVRRFSTMKHTVKEACMAVLVTNAFRQFGGFPLSR